VRYLAIDLGGKRTGLAVGDDDTRIISPLHIIELPPGPALLREITAAAREHDPDAFVLGLPLNMDGTEGAPARDARAFGEALQQAIHKPVHYQDERLTSFAADQQMARSGRTHKQKARRRDALAAAQILRDYLERAL
jgi:putative Holliday junction resolvase